MENTQEKIENEVAATESVEEAIVLSDVERRETEERAEEFVKSQILVLPKKSMTEISKDRDLLIGALGQNIRLEHAIIDNYAEQDRISDEIIKINTKPELVLPTHTDVPYPEKPKIADYNPIEFSSGYKAIWRNSDIYNAQKQETKRPLNKLWIFLSTIVGAILGVLILEMILSSGVAIPRGKTAIELWLEKDQLTILFLLAAVIGGGVVFWMLFRLMQYIPVKLIASVGYTALAVIIFPVLLVLNSIKLKKIKEDYSNATYRWAQKKNKIDADNKEKRLANEQKCNEMIKKADKEWLDGTESRKEQTKQLQKGQLKLQIFCERTKEALAVANQKFSMPSAYADLAIQEDVYNYVRLYRAYNLAEALNLYEMEKRARLNEEKEERYREKSLASLQDIYIENIRSNKKREEIEAKRAEQERQHMLTMQMEAKKQTDYLRKSNELKAESNAQAKAAQEEAVRSNREMERQLATQSEYAIKDYRGW